MVTKSEFHGLKELCFVENLIFTRVSQVILAGGHNVGMTDDLLNSFQRHSPKGPPSHKTGSKVLCSREFGILAWFSNYPRLSANLGNQFRQSGSVGNFSRFASGLIEKATTFNSRSDIQSKVQRHWSFDYLVVQVCAPCTLGDSQQF